VKRLIRKILREQFEYKQQLFNLLKTGDSNNIEMVRIISQGQDIDVAELLIEYFKENPKSPYFKLLNHFDLSEEELIYIFSEIFGEPVRYGRYGYDIVYDKNVNLLYEENSDGYWWKYEYDKNDNMIHYETSRGFWIKREYDNNGNVIFYENSRGKIIDKR